MRARVGETTGPTLSMAYLNWRRSIGRAAWEKRVSAERGCPGQHSQKLNKQKTEGAGQQRDSKELELDSCIPLYPYILGVHPAKRANVHAGGPLLLQTSRPFAHTVDNTLSTHATSFAD